MDDKPTAEQRAALEAGLATKKRAYTVANNLATWDGDWETVAVEAGAYIKALEAALAERDMPPY